MRPYQLKRNILYSAIQGKLVSQVVSDGTGKELLKENAKAISSLSDTEKKKIGKTCKPIGESDKLFDIPDSWEWERFGNLVINYDSQRKPVTKSDRKSTHGLYDYYGATGAIDRVDEYIFDGEYLMIGEDGGNFFVDRDNSFIASGAFWANNHVHVVKPIVCDIGYLKTCLDAYDLPNMGLINGIAVPKLNQENMNSIMIPVPPLAEQKRIVDKIEELLPLIDRYEKAWNRLEEFNKRFPDDLQKSLLQMAIQGKLVEQRPEEGTAEELYQQIQKEKQRLIREGKIKKEKPLSEIAEEEKPFDIPESWKWVRIQDLFNVRSALRIHQTDWKTSGIPFFRGRELVQLANNGTADFEIYISRELYEKNKEKGGVPQKDDILISAVGTLGKVYIVQGTREFYYKDAYILCLENIGKLYPNYIKFALESPYMQTEIRRDSMATTVAQLTIIKLQSLLLPLPPLAEQHHIVAKLEELLPLCDKLKG